MKNIYLFLLFISTFLTIKINAQTTGPSNDEINLERYWYLRSELRNRFVIQGEGTGCGQPIDRITEWGYPPPPGNWVSNELRIDMGDATIELGWYWIALSTEYYLLNSSNENTDQTIEELYFALEAFNRLDRIAELMWEGGNTINNPNGLAPTWVNNEWLMNGKDLNTISSEYISLNVNSSNLSSASTWDYKNGNTGVLNGFFVRSDANVSQASHFYLAGASLQITQLKASPYLTESSYKRATEMSKDQLMHILLGLAACRKFVDATATYNGHNIQQMVIDIGERLYKLFRTYNGFYVNEHNWVIHNPCNTCCNYNVLTFVPGINGNPPSTSPSGDAGRCTEFAPGLAAIFDYIIDKDIYYPDYYTPYLTNVSDYHQNLISLHYPASQIWHNWNTIVAPYMSNPANQTPYQAMSLNFQAFSACMITVGLPLACMVTSTMANSYLPSDLNDFGAHMALTIAAGGNSWHSVSVVPPSLLTPPIIINKTDERLYQVGNLAYDPSMPYNNVFPIYYLIHKAMYPSESTQDLWSPSNIEFQLNQMECGGPYLSQTPNVNYPWQSNNRWHSDNPLLPDITYGEDEFNGIDYIVLYNLYRMLYGSMNTTSNGSLLAYKNYLDFEITKDYPDANGNGDQGNAIEHYVFQNLTATNAINSPTPPSNNNYEPDAGDVTYIAGWKIKLQPGFKAEYGTHFVAKIDHEPCTGTTDPYPNLLKKDITDDTPIANPITTELANQRMAEGRMDEPSSNNRFQQIVDNKSNKTQSMSDVQLRVFPNPIGNNEICLIEFRLEENDVISIDLMDMYGRKINPIISAVCLKKGIQTIEFNVGDLNSGVYIINFISQQHSATLKIIVD